MKDALQRALETADRARTGWNLQRMREALNWLHRRIRGGAIDWDEGNEEWGRILVEGKPESLVSARLPLVIVTRRHEELSRSCAMECGVTCFVAGEFDVPEHSVDKQLLERVFGREMSGAVTYENLTIDDLWWATVT